MDTIGSRFRNESDVLRLSVFIVVSAMETQTPIYSFVGFPYTGNVLLTSWLQDTLCSTAETKYAANWVRTASEQMTDIKTWLAWLSAFIRPGNMPTMANGWPAFQSYDNDRQQYGRVVPVVPQRIDYFGLRH